MLKSYLEKSCNYLAFFIIIRASAVNPANAIITWSSKTHIFCTVRSSCNLAVAFFSTPSTTVFFPLTPTAVEPFFTASWAYSTYHFNFRDLYFSFNHKIHILLYATYWFIPVIYSYILTWKRWPSGEKTVIARSYRAAIVRDADLSNS